MNIEKILEIINKEIELEEKEEKKDVITSIYKEMIQENGFYFYYEILLKATHDYFGYKEENEEILKHIAKDDLNCFQQNMVNPKSIIGKLLSLCMRRLYRKYEYTVRENFSERAYSINLLREITALFDNNSKSIFTNFKELIIFLSNFNLRQSQQIELILEIIRINNEHLKKVKFIYKIINIEKIKGHHFKFINEKLLNRCIECNELDLLLNSKLLKDLFTKMELKKFIKRNSLDLENFRSTCESIETIISKENKIDEDYELLTEKLISLGLDNFSYKIVRSMKKSNLTTSSEKEITKRQEFNNVIMPKKQMNAIIRELNTYFNFEDMEVIRTLTMEEIIYVISLLRKISANETTIKEFLIKSEKLLRKENVIVLFLNYEDKIKYYLSNEEIKKSYEMINSLFPNLFICSDLEYQEYKELLDLYLKEILDILGNDYTYELKSNKLSK